MNKYEKALERIKKNVTPADDWTAEDWEHYKAIIGALSKQTPIKPRKENFYGAAVNMCPVCRAFLNGLHHCGKCGQAIDWK